MNTIRRLEKDVALSRKIDVSRNSSRQEVPATTKRCVCRCHVLKAVIGAAASSSTSIFCRRQNVFDTSVTYMGTIGAYEIPVLFQSMRKKRASKQRQVLRLYLKLFGCAVTLQSVLSNVAIVHPHSS